MALSNRINFRGGQNVAPFVWDGTTKTWTNGINVTLPNNGLGSTESEATKPLPSGCKLYLTFGMYSSNNTTHGMYAWIVNADSEAITAIVSEQFAGNNHTITQVVDLSAYVGIPIKIRVGCQHNGAGSANFSIQQCSINNA